MAATLVAILTTAVIGLPVALAVDRRLRGGALTGLGLLYGSGVVYGILLMLSVLRIAWSLPVVTACSLGVAAIAFAWRWRRGSPASSETHDRLPASSGAHPIDIATLVVCAAYVRFATIAPVWEWDFWAIWGLKARVFFEGLGIDWRFLSSPWNDFAHPDYPLLLPLNLVHAALWNGSWDDRWLGAITAAFGLATVLVVRSMVADEEPPIIASAAGLVAAGLGLSRFIGLAEGPLIAYATGALLMIRRGVHERDDRALRNGALLLGLAASCKNEGIALLVTAALALLFATREWRRVLRLWPSLVVAAPWLVLKAVHGLRSDLAVGPLAARFVERLGAADVILAALARHLPDRLLWLALLLALLCIPAALRRREQFVLAATALQILIYITAYFMTPRDVLWHITTSWPRLTTHVMLPLAVVTLLMLAQVFRPEEDAAHAEARSGL